MTYAVYDQIDRCWLGNEKGVVTYPDRDIAAMACTVIIEQMDLDYSMPRVSAASQRRKTRYRTFPYDGTANKLKDSVPTKMTPLQAIQKIEGFKE